MYTFARYEDEAVIDHWAVKPSGNREQDWDTGARFAREVIARIGQTGNGSVLGHIVAKMPQELSGIERGFLCTFGELAA
jgi:hypothetical protein